MNSPPSTMLQRMVKIPIITRTEAKPYTAMLRDRFGTSWMLLHQPESPELPVD